MNNITCLFYCNTLEFIVGQSQNHAYWTTIERGIEIMELRWGEKEKTRREKNEK